MYIVYISNYKRKLITLGAICVFLLLATLVTGFIVNNGLIFNVTIDNYLSFSYSYAFEVDNIYINDQIDKSVIETNSTFKRPLAQKFSSFKSLKGNFVFDYPPTFTLSQQDFPGSDILYHIDFFKKDKTTHGFVQVWNMPYSMKDFLDKSKAQSTLNYKYFSSNPVTVNNVPGYYWDYSVLGNDGKYYKGSEVFFQKGNRMYRISYFVPESMWNKSEEDVFWSIVNSFKTF